MKARSQGGFTLVEMAIACAMSGILAAVALPNYTAQVQKARRADALAGMALVQHAQERYRSLHPQYATTLEALGLKSSDAGPHHSLSLGLSSGIGYTVQAQAKAPGDSPCATLQVVVLRSVNTRTAKTAHGADSSSACFPQ